VVKVPQLAQESAAAGVLLPVVAFGVLALIDADGASSVADAGLEGFGDAAGVYFD